MKLKLKKVWKTTTPFRYDLNQIPYDYTVEVRKRFKGIDLIDRVPEELRTEIVSEFRLLLDLSVLFMKHSACIMHYAKHFK